MESFSFVVLFTVVVVGWVLQSARRGVAPSRNSAGGAVTCFERVFVRAGRPVPCLVRQAIPHRRMQSYRLYRNRGLDSDRGRPPLYLN